MYIKELHIEEFGPLENVLVENLPQSMAVFLGDNEAGKSSSMEFIRTMLTGIPNRRDLFYQSMKKFKGGTMLIDDEKYGEMLLERKFSARSNRNLKVFGKNREKIENEIYFDLLDHISQDVYRLIFGFNLTELQNFSAFQENDIFENILGASYGLGLNSPDFAIQKLQNEMDLLYKQKGKNSILHNLFVHWKEEFDLAEEAKQRVEKFDELQKKLGSAKESHKELVQEKERVQAYKKEIIQLLTIWTQWKKWADLQKKFAHVKMLSSGTFSAYEGGAEVLFAKIMEQCRLKKEHLSFLMQEQHDYEIKINQFKIDNAIVEHYQEIKDLSFLSLDFTKLLTEQPIIEVQIEQAKYVLATQNAKCIEKWLSFDRKNNFAHNFSVEESMAYFHKLFDETQFFEIWTGLEANLREAKAQVQNAKTALEYAKRDVEKAELKYKAVCEEKGNSFDYTLLVPQALVQNNQEQNWEDFLQENKQKEQDLLELSAIKCSAFLNAVRELGFHVNNAIFAKSFTKDNVEEYITQYVQLAQTVREMYQEKAWLEEKVQAFHVKYAEMNAYMEKAQIEKTAQQEKEIQNKQKKEKIYTLEDNALALLQQIEDENKKKQENVSDNSSTDIFIKYANIPAYLCGGSGLLLLFVRLFNDDNLAETFLGNLHIPFFLPILLLVLCVAQLLMLHFFANKPEEKNADNFYTDKQESFLQELIAIQKEEEQLLQAFFPNEPIEKNEDSSNQDIEERLGFGEALTQKIMEKDKPVFEQELEKIKEKQQVLSRYISLINQPEIYQIDTQLQDEIECLDKEVNALEDAIVGFFEKYSCNVPAFEHIAEFMDRLEKLDQFVQEINALTVSVRKCYDNYQKFIDWTKENVQELYEQIKNANKDTYITCLTNYINTQKEKYLQEIQKEHGAIFADSLASLDESKEHYQSVVKAVQDRQANVHKIYVQCADFLVQETLLQERSKQDFINALCKEENEQDVMAGEFAKVKALVDALFHLHTLFEEQEKRKEEISSLKGKAKAFIEPLRAVLMRIEYVPSKPIKVDTDYLHIYKELLVHTEKEMEKNTRRELVIQELEKVKEQYQNALQELKKIELTLDRLYKAAGVKNEQELMILFGQLKESEKYIQQAIAIEESLQEIAEPQYVAKSSIMPKREYKELENQRSLPNIFYYFDDEAKKRFEQTLAELQEEEDGLIAIEKHIRELEIKVEAESNFVYEESLSNEASFRMKKIEDEIKDNYNKWLEFSFAKEILLRAKKQYEETSQPLIVKIASEFFTKITDDKWQGIRVSLEDRRVLVVDENGTLLNAEMLSQGAREQLYLSLRLAHIKHRATTKRTLPILMDDILVNFDEKRVRNTANLLCAMVDAKENDENKQQFFFYTCHEKTAKIIEEMVTGTKIYHVQNKKVFAM